MATATLDKIARLNTRDVGRVNIAALARIYIQSNFAK